MALRWCQRPTDYRLYYQLIQSYLINGQVVHAQIIQKIPERFSRILYYNYSLHRRQEKIQLSLKISRLIILSSITPCSTRLNELN